MLHHLLRRTVGHHASIELAFLSIAELHDHGVAVFAQVVEVEGVALVKLRVVLTARAAKLKFNSYARPYGAITSERDRTHLRIAE